FFRDPFAAHHEYMRQMMRSFSDPFGRDPFLSIMDGRERAVERRSCHESQVAPGGSRRPFFAMDRMMSNMRNSMLEMKRKFDDLSVHPDAHTFSSSSVMTYSKVGDEPPKVFQASAQTRTAPGGVKETRKALKDSESGVEKMAIGHHIHDRAHVVKKSKNTKTGDEELNQEFINLDESDAQTFDEEWQKEVLKFKPSRATYNVDAPKYRNLQILNKMLVKNVYVGFAFFREKPLTRTPVAGSRGPRISSENLSVKGSHVPIKSSKK
ncbi:MLF1 factor, partial [Nothoprocta pentlandii]|nr:MLF1 factor [Nothoprocta pentlandii]